MRGGARAGKGNGAALTSLRRYARDHDRKLDAIVGDRKNEFVSLLKKIAAEII